MKGGAEPVRVWERHGARRAERHIEVVGRGADCDLVDRGADGWPLVTTVFYRRSATTAGDSAYVWLATDRGRAARGSSDRSSERVAELARLASISRNAGLGYRSPDDA